MSGIVSFITSPYCQSNIPTPATDVTLFLKNTADYKTVVGNTRPYGKYEIRLTRPLVKPIKFYVLPCHFLILSQISTPCHPISSISILILSSKPNYEVSKWPFPHVCFRPKFQYAFIFFPVCATCPSHLFLLDLETGKMVLQLMNICIK